MTDIVQRLRERGDTYGIPIERDCAEASALISKLRSALQDIRKQSLMLRGEQSYRDFARSAKRIADAALSQD
jgi:hypothetical protein